ncbi:MAG: hypothetical protein ACYDEV_08960 [Acidiferrobacter sp.]
MPSWFPTGSLWRLAERSILWPFLLTAGTLLVVSFITRRRPSMTMGAGIVAFIVMALFAFSRINAAWAFPPRQPLDWLPLLASVAGVGNGYFGPRRPPALRRSLFRFLMIAGTVIVLMAPVLRAQPLMIIAEAVLSGILGERAWWLLEQMDERAAPTGMVPLFSIAAANLVIAPWTGSLLLGELSGSLATILGVWAAWAYRCRLRHTPCGAGVRGFAIVYISGLLIMERAYSATPVYLLAILLTAILAAALAVHLMAQRHIRLGVMVLGATCAAIIPSLIAIGMAHGLYIAQGGY